MCAPHGQCLVHVAGYRVCGCIHHKTDLEKMHFLHHQNTTRKRKKQGTGNSTQIIKKGFRYSNKLIKVTVLHIIPQWAKIGTKDSPSHEQTDKLTSCNFLGCNHDTTLTTQTPSHQQKILVEKKT